MQDTLIIFLSLLVIGTKVIKTNFNFLEDWYNYLHNIFFVIIEIFDLNLLLLWGFSDGNFSGQSLFFPLSSSFPPIFLESLLFILFFS